MQPPPAISAPQPRPYHIIAGCFREQGNAHRALTHWQSAGYQQAAITEKINDLHPVCIAVIDDKDEAISRLEMERDKTGKTLWLHRYPEKTSNR